MCAGHQVGWFTRIALAIPLSAGACAGARDSPASVRAALERGETGLAIDAVEDAGAITARRRSSSGWVTGEIALSVREGSLAVRARSGADSGGAALDVTGLDIELAPIELPASLLGYAARLVDVRLAARQPVTAALTWRGDDEARAVAAVALALSWSLEIDGRSWPLGAPELPAVPLELAFAGGDGALRADVRAGAPGALWSWAELVELDDLELRLTAGTVAL